MIQDKHDYRKYCINNDSIPIFVTDWWLDQVCGENNWDVSLVRSDDKIIASMPYYLRKNHLGLNYIFMPQLTPFMGPHIVYSEEPGHSSRLSFEHKIIQELINLLPRYVYFYQKLHYSITNWMPFFWNGFQQTTYYTHTIEDLTDIDRLFSSLERDRKANIRNAEKILTVETSDDIDDFYRINALTWKRQGLSTPYSLDFVKRIDEECKKRKCRRLLFAKDDSGRIHSASYMVWDKASSYSLMAGMDPELKKSNAGALLLWEEIKFSSKVTKRFDFAGSMVKSIEKFNRGYNGKQMPYSKITKSFESSFQNEKEYLMTQLPSYPNINLNSTMNKLYNRFRSRH